MSSSEEQARVMGGNTKQNILRFLMWNMRWMTRYIGFVARPFARFYASQEILACGIRYDSSVHIIYIQKYGESEYTYSKKSSTWDDFEWKEENDFAAGLVPEISIKGARLGELYRVCAENKSGRFICSPSITIKGETVDISNYLQVSRQGGKAKFDWLEAEKHKSMVYFLSIEGNEQTLAAIYTKETSWTYSNLKSASLSLGPENPKPIQDKDTYLVKLILIDFDGWVSHKAEKMF